MKEFRSKQSGGTAQDHIESRALKRGPPESGNVFFALFGAVAMVGVVGASTMTIMNGPVRTMAEVNRRTVAETSMMAASRMVMAQAVVDGAGDGDCDADGFVEPLAFKTPGVGQPRPVGGGYIPDSVGSQKQDPWGTEFGYCVWDHGAALLQAGCGGAGANRLSGVNNDAQPVVALISAGPDKQFQSYCYTLNQADTKSAAQPSTGVAGNSNGAIDGNEKLFVKVAGSDDAITLYTYAEGQGIMGGLWRLKDASPDTAQIDRKLEVVDDGGNMTFSLDNLTGTGDFMAVKTDNIFARTAPLTAGGGTYDQGLVAMNAPLRAHGVTGAAAPSGGGGGSGGPETDPQVGALTNAKWCTSDGTMVNCTSDAPADSDTLASLNCNNGDTIIYTGSVWACAPVTGGGGGTDDAPSAFNFVDRLQSSNSFQHVQFAQTSGFTGPLAATVTGAGGAEIRKRNVGTWGTSVDLNNGDELEIRMTAASTTNTTKTATVTLGNYSTTWTITTSGCFGCMYQSVCRATGYEYQSACNAPPTTLCGPNTQGTRTRYRCSIDTTNGNYFFDSISTTSCTNFADCPSGNCFAAGTSVLMADGSYKAIEGVRIGERVKGRTGINTVIALKPTALGDRALWTVDGKVKTTADHLALTEQGPAAISPDEYGKRDYQKYVPVVTDDMGTTAKRLFGGPHPSSVSTLAKGSRIAYGDEDYRLITTLSSETMSPETPLYTLVLDGDGTMQLEGGYVYYGFDVPVVKTGE